MLFELNVAFVLLIAATCRNSDRNHTFI